MVWLASCPSGPIPGALELTCSPRQVRQVEACRAPAEGVVEVGGRGEAAMGGDRAREAPGARALPPVAAVAAGMRRSEWSRGAPL